MPAAATDKYKKLSKRWVGQIGAAGVSDAVTQTVPLSSVTNLPTDTAVVAVIDRVDANGTATAAVEETVVGIVSGSNLANCVRGAEGTAQAHNAGAVVEILVTAKSWNDLIDGLLVEHTQLGKHGNITTGTVTASDVISTTTNVTASAIGSVSATKPLEILTGKYQPFQAYTPAGGATATLDLALGNHHRITMPAGNAVVALTHDTTGQKFLIDIKQDSVGSRTVTWFSGISWAGGVAPTLTTTANKTDTLGITVITGGSAYLGYIVGQNI